MKTNPLEKMKKRSPRTRFFWCYTLGFLLCAAGCYCWFLIKGKTLIVDSDGWRQHFAAFVYLGQYGREVARTLLTTHKLVLPQWDFSIGLGSDVLTTLHFYAIGDPLDLLSVVCPTRYAAYLYSFLSLLRLYLAGLAFGAFCFVKRQRRVGGVTVGALVYVFTLYSLFIVSHHPFFALPKIFLRIFFTALRRGFVWARKTALRQAYPHRRDILPHIPSCLSLRKRRILLSVKESSLPLPCR